MIHPQIEVTDRLFDLRSHIHSTDLVEDLLRPESDLSDEAAARSLEALLAEVRRTGPHPPTSSDEQ